LPASDPANLRHFGRITGLDIMAIPFTGQHHH
jgi:hypothetical protein